MDERVWLEVCNVESSLIVWITYREDVGGLCCHPINDWSSYEVRENNLEELLNESDEAIDVDVKLQDETPLAE